MENEVFITEEDFAVSPREEIGDGFCHLLFLDDKFTKIKDHLSSNGIDISYDDLLKTYDVFFRVSGIGVGANSNHPNTPCNIMSIVHESIQCPEIEKWDTLNNEESIKKYPVLLKSIDDGIDKTRKFEDLDTISNNIIPIFKDFILFTNTLFSVISKLSTQDKISYQYSICSSKDDEQKIFISHKEVYPGVWAILLSSTILYDRTSDTITIMLDTFSEEVQELLTNEQPEDLLSEIKSDKTPNN